SNRFESLQDTADPRRTAEGLWTANERVTKRRRLLRGSAIVAGTALLGWQVLPQTPLPRLARAWGAEHRSATGEIRNLVLADGTQVWLNTASPRRSMKATMPASGCYSSEWGKFSSPPPATPRPLSGRHPAG